MTAKIDQRRPVQDTADRNAPRIREFPTTCLAPGAAELRPTLWGNAHPRYAGMPRSNGQLSPPSTLPSVLGMGASPVPPSQAAEPGRIDDANWQRIVQALPGRIAVRAGNDGRRYRLFVEAVLWVADHNACWGELPSRFGPWRAVYMRFLRWNTRGTWEEVARILGRTPVVIELLRRADQHKAMLRRHQNRKARSWSLEP